MDILHLTDLHLTPPIKSLEEQWATAHPKLGTRRFDFIVLSGDLAQSAAAKQYDQLLQFCEKSLLEWLKPPVNRNRVIIVPGNHDVDRSQDVFDAVDVSQLDESALKAAMRELESSAYRLKMDSANKQLTFVKIAPDRYQKRFVNVQKFLNDFYGKAVPPADRRFNLADEGGAQWSAHVFPGQKVAFFGFNSCERTDAHWTGASISREAIRTAAAHARRHADGMVWIAVWHHGMVSENGKPDHLSASDLGFLFHNGFRLGIHGHTHEDELRDFSEILGNRFPIVGPGSFGAGPNELPPGLLNQFSIVSLNANYLAVERFSRDVSSQWISSWSPVYELQPSEPPREERSSAKAHERILFLDERSGIATVKITLTDLFLDGELTLATPAGPFANHQYARELKTKGKADALPVRRTVLPDGRERLSVFGDRDHYDSAEWSFSMSNSLALTQQDLKFRERFFDWSARVDEDLDVVAHAVRFRVDKLVMGLRSRRDLPFFDAQRRKFIVFERTPMQSWREDAVEAARATPTGDETRLEVTVDNPHVGRMYILGYKPKEPGFPYGKSSNVLTAVTRVIERIRTSSNGGALAQRLTEAVERGIRDVLATPSDAPIEWYGYLWHREERKLVTIFGRFPQGSSGVCFGFGEGVVGHCFRLCTPAAYFQSAERHSLIFVPNRQSPRAAPRWVACFPILLSAHGPAVGVIGFAGFDTERRWDLELREYAEWAARRAEDADAAEAAGRAPLPLESGDEERKRLQNDLTATVTMQFWKSMARAPASELSSFALGDARRVLQSWNELFKRSAEKAQ